MKYKLQAINDFEVISPATEIIETNLMTGEKINTGVKIPESRYSYKKGHSFTVHNKVDWVSPFLFFYTVLVVFLGYLNEVFHFWRGL